MLSNLCRSIFLIAVFLMTACSPQSPAVPPTPSPTPVPVMQPRGQAIEILYDDDANELRHFLFENQTLRIRWANQAYAEGWRPWLAKVMIQSDQRCLISTADSFSKDKGEMVITDTGGYSRDASIMIHYSNYGLRWYICEEMSVMAYVWGVIPRNQEPAYGSFDMNGKNITIDFTTLAEPTFPVRADSERQPEVMHQISGYGVDISLKPLSFDDENGDALTLEVAITNNGGYDVGGVTFMAVDNLGRYYNDASGSPARVGPGVTQTATMRVYNPFPFQKTGDVTSAVFIVFAETEPRSYQYMGTFYAQYGNNSQ